MYGYRVREGSRKREREREKERERRKESRREKMIRKTEIITYGKVVHKVFLCDLVGIHRHGEKTPSSLFPDCESGELKH